MTPQTNEANSNTTTQQPLTSYEQQYRDALRLNPFLMYRQLREKQPVFYNEARKWWELYRYDDILAVLNDTTRFSAERYLPPENPISENLPTRSILNMDPPRHRQLRALINQAFAPRSVTQLTPRINELVNELLDAVTPWGQMDVVSNLAGQLPLRIINAMLGIPNEDIDRIKQMISKASTQAIDIRIPGFQELNEYFKQSIARHRAQPTDDQIDALLKARIEGTPLSERDIINFCVLLLFAGNETLTNLIGNAILCFDEHPNALREVQADLSLLPDALEEILRYLSPVQLLVRSTIEDTVIGGTPIKAGQMLFLLAGSANRDETQFPNPDTFDIRRTPNRHLAFGQGIHFCLGAPLAHVAAKITLTAMLQRFKNIQRVRDIPLKPSDNVFVYGVKSLPITFEPM